MEEVKIVLSQKGTEDEVLEELARVLLMIARDLPEKGLASEETDFGKDHG
jgi:hypothetical protein